MRRVKENVHYFCDDTLFGHIDGHGITTAVLDTGISPHPDLEGRIVAFGDMLHGRHHCRIRENVVRSVCRHRSGFPDCGR